MPLQIHQHSHVHRSKMLRVSREVERMVRLLRPLFWRRIGIRDCTSEGRDVQTQNFSEKEQMRTTVGSLHLPNWNQNVETRTRTCCASIVRRRAAGLVPSSRRDIPSVVKMTFFMLFAIIASILFSFTVDAFHWSSEHLTFYRCRSISRMPYSRRLPFSLKAADAWTGGGDASGASRVASGGGYGSIEQIEFKIYPDGRVEELVRGVKGSNCHKITEKINEQLGEVVVTQPTEEMFEQEVQVTQTLYNTDSLDGDWQSSTW